MIRKKDKGITLIALVVTIVILLILGGVTIGIVALPDGLIQTAQGLKPLQEKAEFEDEIKIVNLEMQMQKKLNSEISIEDYFAELKKQGMIKDTTIGGENIKEIGKTQEGDSIYEVTTESGHVFEIVIDKDYNINIEYQGKADSLPPVIREFTVTNSSTNNIEVRVAIDRLQDAKIKYEYKQDEEENYKELKKNTTDLTANYTDLVQGKVYNLKVTVQGKKGKDEKVINGLTGELRSGTITQKGVTGWINGTASIELQTSETGYTIQYQKGSTTGTWQEYTGAIGDLHHGDKVFARIYDGTNGSAETMITISDGIAPTVEASTGTTTTKSIQIIGVEATDSESGMPTNPTYKYYIKKSSVTTWPTTASYTGSNTSYTFNNLDQNSTYDVKITTQDIAGNPGEKILRNISTGEVGGATSGLKTGNITAGTVSWNSSTHTASVTLNTTTGLTIEYKKGSSDSWHTGTAGASSVNVTELSNNTVLITRLTDGRNTGSEASITILDGTDPSEATISLSTTSTTSGTTITATVTHRDDQSGVAISSCKYIYNTISSGLGKTNSSWNSAQSFSSNGQTINLTAPAGGVNYYLHVLTVDNAGNKTEKVSSAVSVQQLATGISLNTTNAVLSTGETLSLVATISPNNTSNKSIKWTSSNTNVATVSDTGVVTIKKMGNATITATTSDGSDKSATCTIRPTWELSTQGTDASGTINDNSSTSNPTVLSIGSSNTGAAGSILNYNKTIPANSTIEIECKATRGSTYYLQLFLLGKSYPITTGYGGTYYPDSDVLKPDTNYTVKKTTTSAINNFNIWISRTGDCYSGTWINFYIYSVKINGQKVL